MLFSVRERTLPQDLNTLEIFNNKQVYSLCVDSQPGDRLRLIFCEGSSLILILPHHSVKLSLKLTARLR